MVELDEKPSQEEVQTLRQMVLEKYELNLAANAGKVFQDEFTKNLQAISSISGSVKFIVIKELSRLTMKTRKK